MTGLQRRFAAWFFEGLKGSGSEEPNRADWWQVMCLTGTGYFSSMGFQPGIAYLAAGVLSPFATLFLVLLTLLGAAPSYIEVAKQSPQGEGSFAIFERLLPGWKGKTTVLILLGFAATDFIFAITMCSADATVHIVENPWIPRFAHDQIIVTMALIAVLGGVFLLGFQEAVKVSVLLVGFFLAVNLISFCGIFAHLFQHPELIQSWYLKLASQYQSPALILSASFLNLPQLALGLSGFETGVAVMPLIKTASENQNEDCAAKTKLLLLTAASVMALFLLAGSLATTLLIEPAAFLENGPANGRALSYLTHIYLGDGFGAVYDLSTVLILWFAGASGMAALLGFVPQYLPRYGMAPNWSRARRPLVIFFTLSALLITWLFKADVDAQAPPFATGLLVLICSAAIAVTMSLWKSRPALRFYFLAVSAVLSYACIALMHQQPDGLEIAFVFIAIILVSSFLSRAWRSTELRIGQVVLDETARKFIEQSRQKDWKQIRLLAHRAGGGDYHAKEQSARRDHSIQKEEGNFIFLEVEIADASEFSDSILEVSGRELDGFQILSCRSSSVPNAIAALLLHLRDESGEIPHAYLGWTEGHPLSYMVKYILFGEGETAPLAREILRSAEPDPDRRPKIHVA